MTLKAYRPNQYQKNDQSDALVPDLKERLESFPKPDFGTKGSKFKKIFAGVFLISTVSAISYLTYSAFKYSTPPASIDEIQLVRADVNPVKALPVEPGGTQFENQDKLIYKNLEDPNLKTPKDNPEEELIKKEDIQLRTPPVVAKKQKKQLEEVAKKEEKKMDAEPKKQEAKVETKEEKVVKQEPKIESAKAEPKPAAKKTAEVKPKKEEVASKKTEVKTAKKDAYQDKKVADSKKSAANISAAELEKKIDEEINTKSKPVAASASTSKPKEPVNNPFDLLDNAQ